MTIKNILILLGCLVLLGAGYFLGQIKRGVYEEDAPVSRVSEEVIEESADEGTSQETAQFQGELQEVNTGCFSDGECFVVVDGKHITTTMGWSREVVGSVRGIEGFGDLERHIGEQIEVYAGVTEDGAYTLYGNEEFFIQLLPSE